MFRAWQGHLSLALRLPVDRSRSIEVIRQVYCFSSLPTASTKLILISSRSTKAMTTGRNASTKSRSPPISRTSLHSRRSTQPLLNIQTVQEEDTDSEYEDAEGQEEEEDGKPFAQERTPPASNRSFTQQIMDHWTGGSSSGSSGSAHMIPPPKKERATGPVMPC